MFGAGWGGIESIIVGVLAATGIINVYLYQSGLIETMIPPDQMEANAEAIAAGAAQIEALVNAPAYTWLLGAVERIFAITLHISLSILVLQAVVRKNFLWVVVAIFWHALVNAVAVFGSLQGWDPLLIEVGVGIGGVISFLIILYFRDNTPSPESDEPIEVQAEAA